MQYVITWFGLAGAVMIAFAVWLFRQHRRVPKNPLIEARQR